MRSSLTISALKVYRMVKLDIVVTQGIAKNEESPVPDPEHWYSNDKWQYTQINSYNSTLRFVVIITNFSSGTCASFIEPDIIEPHR